MEIQRVKCRAKVTIGGLEVNTPYVQSFNVRKQRGQVTTFDASLKVLSEDASIMSGGDVTIHAGEGFASKLLVTGICRGAKISPCFDDPKYVILSISGSDKLSHLQGKKFTRRWREHDDCWAAITGVARQGLRSGKFAYNTEANFNITGGRLQKEDPTSGYRSANPIDGPSPSRPATGENEGTVTPQVSYYSEAQTTGDGG